MSFIQSILLILSNLLFVGGVNAVSLVLVHPLVFVSKCVKVCHTPRKTSNSQANVIGTPGLHQDNIFFSWDILGHFGTSANFRAVGSAPDNLLSHIVGILVVASPNLEILTKLSGGVRFWIKLATQDQCT